MDETTPEITGTTHRTRRGVLSSLLAAGATIAVASRASAADTGASPTTTSPPHRTGADIPVINTLIAREADMVATYEAALAGTSGDDLAALELIHSHHLAYVQALAAYLGRDAVAAPGTALALTGSGYSRVARELAGHERATVDAHVTAMGSVAGLDAATLVASIVTAEARHIGALQVSATGTVQSLAEPAPL
ncbi:MAG: ferritin-like domain-containing protein [Acidimicrobiales bacterium]